MIPEQARGLKDDAAAVSAEARALTAGMDAGALMARPKDGGWSVGENLQHLILTADAMLPLGEGAVAELERAGRRSDRRTGLGFMGWLLVQSLEPPRMKTKTLKAFEPIDVGDPLTLTDRFVATNDRLARLIERATGLATGTVTLTSPFNAKVTYNLYAAMRILLVHARRHLWQARAAKGRVTGGA